MSAEAAKVCPYCAEQIKAAAKVCPHCRQWLSGCSLKNPAIFYAVFCLCFFVLIVGFLLFFQRLINPGMDFSLYRDSISVVESRMNIENGEKESWVNVVVVVTNRSDFAWKDIQLDARFFDKTGTLIDARTWSERSRILPHGDLALRIKTKPCVALASYQSYKVYVRAARDARAPF